MEDIDLGLTARLVADPTRSLILKSLLDGRALTAGELAKLTGVSASTVSEHVGKLIDGGLVAVASQGRHRYVRLANAEIAFALESLAAVSAPVPVASLRMSNAAKALRPARMCYDHIAGELGVRISDFCFASNFVSTNSDGLTVTPAGIDWFNELGIPVNAAPRGSRPAVRTCLDWTERRFHLAGLVPAAFAVVALESGWLERRAKGERGLTITPSGRTTFDRLLR